MKKPSKNKNSKVKNTKNIDTTVDIVLEGHVFIEEKDRKGKIVSKSEIDGDVILRLILQAIQNGVGYLEAKNEKS